MGLTYPVRIGDLCDRLLCNVPQQHHEAHTSMNISLTHISALYNRTDSESCEGAKETLQQNKEIHFFWVTRLILCHHLCI